MKPLVIFGIGLFGEVAHFHFTHDSDYEVVAFTVDNEYLKEKSFMGLPVIAFEELATECPPGEVSLFVAVGYSQLNRLRAEKFFEAEQQGYELVSYVSSRATVWPELQLGRNCFVLEGNTIQPFTSVGDNVVMWSGNHLGHHSSIASHCYISGHVVISGVVQIGEYCFVGVGAIIRDHVRVGSRSVIGMGSLIMADVKDDSVHAAKGTPRSPVPSHRLLKL